jgi:2-polyprenyl-6-hydroxyphenyl methylase/3-demethylubiquinone-9 3-methyltransferase
VGHSHALVALHELATLVSAIGCGGGLLSEPLARLGANVTGIDADITAITIAKDHAARQGLEIDYRVGSVENLREKFDCICALEIIEHVDNPQFFIASLAKLLKPNGMLILSTLNRTQKSYLFGIVVAENILRWAPEGTHDWNKFITPEELRELLTNVDLRTVDTTGLMFHPLLRQWKLSHRLGINYFVTAVKNG